MIKPITTFVALALFSLLSFSQQFYRVGSPDNIDTEPQWGILLAGGATDNDDGMKWLAERANGGDVVVLRASGGDGYNSYILNGLGVEINSVTTIVIVGSGQANNPEVCNAVNNAEMVFIAGGDQWYYYDEWKGTCLQTALNNHVNEKNAPIGGTSAGLAVLGEVVYTAENGTVTSDQALANPFHNRVSLSNDFLSIPFMENIVTDSHYAERDRQGRHMVFLARMKADWGMDALGIGVDEYTAVGVDENGIASVFGHPSHDDYAYFLKANGDPEKCESGQPLTWNNGQNAVTVYKVKGTYQGTNTFDLSNWQEGQGGEWWSWYVLEGELFMIPLENVSIPFVEKSPGLKVFPNPVTQWVNVESPSHKTIDRYRIFDMRGNLVLTADAGGQTSLDIDLSRIAAGTYLLYIYHGKYRDIRKIVIQ